MSCDENQSLGRDDLVGRHSNFFLSKEAGAGIEPANSGFADRDLTTWLPRHLCEE